MGPNGRRGREGGPWCGRSKSRLEAFHVRISSEEFTVSVSAVQRSPIAQCVPVMSRCRFVNVMGKRRKVRASIHLWIVLARLRKVDHGLLEIVEWSLLCEQVRIACGKVRSNLDKTLVILDKTEQVIPQWLLGKNLGISCIISNARTILQQIIREPFSYPTLHFHT